MGKPMRLLLLNLIIMAITAAFNLTLGEVDWVAYLLYFS